MAKNTSITLGDHFNDFIAHEIASGRFGTTSEVVRAGLRLLEFEEKKLEALRAAIDEGDASPESEDIDGEEVFARLRGKFGLESPRG
jgi:antitoxin ParD1/3/4